MELLLSHNEPAYLDSVIFVSLLLVIVINCIVRLCQVTQALLHVLLHVSEVWEYPKCSEPDVAAKKVCIDTTANHKLPQNMEKSTDCRNKNLTEEELTKGEVIMVMRKLGTGYDPDGDKLQDKLGSNEITALFKEQEPSAQEVKEAFSMFDENGDGFIDANELKRVLGILCCCSEALEEDCRRMIKAFDRNGDGVIDLDEFVRLVANSFS